MRTFVALAAFVCVAAAQGTQGLPACANKCVGSSFGGCQTLDVACICSNTALIANLACCVGAECDAADQAATLKFANALCAGSGVTNLPQSATCAPGAVSTPQAGTTMASEASGSSTAADSASTTASGESAATTGSESSATSGSGSSATSSASAAGASSGSATASASASASGNAGSKHEVAYGVGAVFLGALAAL